MHIIKLKIISFLVSFLLLLMVNNNVSRAEVVALPEITEVPELEEETLLKDLDIPAVRDRDPDPEAGPRLSISEFRLQGIVEYPDVGITRAEISQIVEDIRFELMGEGQLLESGHTLEELGEISDLLVDIEKNVEEEHVGPEEVQRLVWLVRDQLLKRGVTLGMIETVADRITRYYRERGFILAKAYIPKQKVRDGVVTLTLLLGLLGETKVNDNDLYDAEILNSVFDDLLTKPVTNRAISEKLYLINDFPGINVQGFFEAGSQVGDTLLNINVKSEETFNYNTRVDNHGADETGRGRLYGEFFWNNPTGTADQLHLGVLYSFDPESTVYGQLRYSTNIIDSRFKLSVGFANNSFVFRSEEEGLNALDLGGETNIIDFKASYQMKRSLDENYSFDLLYEDIESFIDVRGEREDGGTLDNGVRNTSLVFNYDFITDGSRMLHSGNVKLTSGQFGLGRLEGQEERHAYIRADYSLLSFWKIPFTDVETRSVLRSSFQYSDSSLSSIDKFALGGAARARSFQAKEFTADQAIYVGFDWFFNLPDFLDTEFSETSLGKTLSPFIFVDAAYGTALSFNESVSDIDATLASAGVGLQFSHEEMSGNLQVAFPIENSSSSSSALTFEESEEETRVLLEFQYRF